jgi:ethanolaminephosphotransferase
MGVVSMINAFIDREKVYTAPLSTVLPDSIASALPPDVTSLQVRHFGVYAWAALCTSMVILCIGRVLSHVKKPKIMFYAVCKLASPFALGACPFVLPPSVLYDSARYISLSVGLAYCLITVKLIFLSMAKMPYAVFQLDILPMVLVCAWVKYDDRLTLLGAKTLFQVATVWYLYRFLKWDAVACQQICDRLDIYVFLIKDKTKKE